MTYFSCFCLNLIYIVLTAIGFVPKTVFWLLVGATSGEVFVEAIPIRFSREAIAVYHWQIPKWLEFLAATQPIPDSFAFLMAKFVLYVKTKMITTFFHN